MATPGVFILPGRSTLSIRSGEEVCRVNRKRLLRIEAGEEPRSSQRYATREFAVEFPIGAAVVDVSESGMGIESSGQLRVGASYVFRVQMGGKAFGMPGRVEWCRFAGTNGTVGVERAAVYRAGISFSSGPAKETWSTALRRLIESGIQPLSVSATS